MHHRYSHLGSFSDWLEAARKQHALYPLAQPGAATQQPIRDLLGFPNDAMAPEDVRVERQWERDGLYGEEVSWSVGYGPRTSSWVLKPVHARSKTVLPGVVALHSHDGFKFFGKEKIADGPDDPSPMVLALRKGYYEGRAFVNELARQGFVVLVHDTFLWGSRRFPLEIMPETTRHNAEDIWQRRIQRGEQLNEIDLYNIAARLHEHLIEKYCTLTGTTLAGMVSYEDRAAVHYLQTRPDVLAERIGCIGLSGGGCRAALLQASCTDIKAAVIVGMMSTYEQLLDHLVDGHTWMFFPSGLPRLMDWSDLAACRAPSPLYVQYNQQDQLFTLQGMQDAHERIRMHYQRSGHPTAYRGDFYTGGHKFDLAMQEAAFDWLKTWLQPDGAMV